MSNSFKYWQCYWQDKKNHITRVGDYNEVAVQICHVALNFDLDKENSHWSHLKRTFYNIK